MGAAHELRSARQDRGLTQAALAQKTGVHQPTISAIENGRLMPGASVLERLMSALAPPPSERVAAHRDEILELVRRRGGREVRIFGSVARGEDRSDSDVDLLIDFRPGTTYFDLAALEEELRELLGIPVDIVSRGSNGPFAQHMAAESVPL